MKEGKPVLSFDSAAKKNYCWRTIEGIIQWPMPDDIDVA